jgi:hypothetical protein
MESLISFNVAHSRQDAKSFSIMTYKQVIYEHFPRTSKRCNAEIFVMMLSAMKDQR